MFVCPLATLISYVFKEYKKTTVMKCVNKRLLCVDNFCSVNLASEKSYLMFQKGSKIKIKKCSKINI